jgi:acetyl esterase/lipase
MAMNVDVDSATKDMPGKVESTVLSVPVKTPMINRISDVVYEQVPMRGYPNVAMKMDILQSKSDTKQPAIVYVTGGGFINANKDNGIQLRMHLAEAGYVVASIQYRVATYGPLPGTPGRCEGLYPLFEDLCRPIRHRPGTNRHHRWQCRRLPHGHGRDDQRHDDL